MFLWVAPVMWAITRVLAFAMQLVGVAGLLTFFSVATWRFIEKNGGESVG